MADLCKRHSRNRIAWLVTGWLCALCLAGACGRPSQTPTPTEPSKTSPAVTQVAATPTPAATPTATVPQPTATLAPLSGSGGGRIVFASKRDLEDVNYDIYVMNADGSDQRRLTFELAEDTVPAWSPDGTQIAFSSDRSGRFEIFIMQADGSGMRQLTRNGGWAPAWSPDGSMIAFHRQEPYNRIYVINADGSGERPLTPPSTEVGVGSTEWSPDGTRMVCVVNKTPELQTGANLIHQIAILEVGDLLEGGTEPTYIELPQASEQINDRPAWSPDGKTIVFSARMGAHRDLYLVDADGTNLRRFTFEDYLDEWAPVFSPDGTRIAFQFSASGGWDIYTINQDGTGLTRLTTNPGNDVSPSWAP